MPRLMRVFGAGCLRSSKRTQDDLTLTLTARLCCRSAENIPDFRFMRFDDLTERV